MDGADAFRQFIRQKHLAKLTLLDQMINAFLTPSDDITTSINSRGLKRSANLQNNSINCI